MPSIAGQTVRSTTVSGMSPSSRKKTSGRAMIFSEPAISLGLVRSPGHSWPCATSPAAVGLQSV